MDPYLSEDAFGRPDIATSYFRLPSAFPTTRLVTAPLQSEDNDLVILSKSLPQSLIQKQQAAELSLNLWRSRDRLLIRQVGLILCLNIGTEPPDRERTVGSEEAGVDLSQVQANSATMIQNAMDEVSRRLQRQYERLEPKARLRTAADPKLEDVRKLVTKLRGHAQRSENGLERILIHYNGHGVPRPTVAGEIWGFNEGYTAYVPLNISEVASWSGSPTMFVFDCENAGRLIPPLVSYYRSKALEKPAQTAIPKDEPLDVLVLGACGAEESLPSKLGLPSDVFTACLTTPLKMSLRWAIHNGGVASFPRAFQSLVDRLPGRISDRKSPLGELHWLLTTITDTIAWTSLPRPLFFRLFRQDILCASLFRNFLVADRIMRTLGVVPVSVPSLPNTHNHPLWLEFDAALHRILSTLPAALGYSVEDIERLDALGLAPDVASAMALSGRKGLDSPAALLVSPDSVKSPRKALKTYWGIDAIDEDDLASETPSGTAGSRTTEDEGRSVTGSNQGAATILSEDGFIDPLTLSVPPAASATPSQRVLFLRRIVQSACLQKSSIHIKSMESEGSSSTSGGITTFFRDSLLSFETWLDRVTSAQALHKTHILVDLFDTFDNQSDSLYDDDDSFRSVQHITASQSHPSTISSGYTNRSCPILRNSKRIRAPPELPVLLQMVLSKDHRLWAMELLARFVRLGPEATNLALLMGFSSYLIKLVDTDVPELRPSLVIIWACILSTARSIQSIGDDLINKANGVRYFEICSGADNNFSDEVVQSARFVLHILTMGRSRNQLLTFPSDSEDDPVSRLFRSKLLSSDPKIRQDTIRRMRTSLAGRNNDVSLGNDFSTAGVDCAAQLFNLSHELYPSAKGLSFPPLELIQDVCNDLCDAPLAFLRGAWVVARCILSSDGTFCLLSNEVKTSTRKAINGNNEITALPSVDYFEPYQGEGGGGESLTETGPPPLDLFAAALISATTAPKRTDSDIAADLDRRTQFALKDPMLSELCSAVWISALIFDGDPIVRSEAESAVASIIFSAPFHLQSISVIAAQSLLDCAAGGTSSLGRFLFGSDNHMQNISLPGLPPGVFTVPILTMFVAQESTVILSTPREGGPRLAEEEYKKNALLLSAVRLFGPRGALYATIWTAMCQACIDGSSEVSFASQRFIRRILFLVARTCAGIQLNSTPVHSSSYDSAVAEFSNLVNFSSSQSPGPGRAIEGFPSQLLPALVLGHEIALSSYSASEVKGLLHQSKSLNPSSTAIKSSDSASEVPRLSPRVLARVQESRVTAARTSMKKFRQHAIIQTEGSYSTSVLFHPFFDFIISSDGAGTGSSFSTNNGERLCTFSVAGSAPPVKLWSEALHEELQSSFPHDGNAANMKRRLQAQKILVSGAAKASLALTIFRQPQYGAPPRLRPPSPVHYSTWIDETSGCHLLTGSEDGTVRVWSGHDVASLSFSKSVSSSLSSPRMLSVFRAAPPATSRTFAMTYLPFNTTLVACGGNGINRIGEAYIRVWDLSSSVCKKLIQLPSSSHSVSCLASPWPGTDTIIAGTTSGAVHVMDMRIRGMSNIVRTFSEHQSHVVNVALSKTGSCYAVASASFASDVRFWDLRIERSLRSVLAQERGKLTCLIAHDFAPLLLTGCVKHGATVLTNAGDEISRIERHDSFNSEPLGPVSSVAWHPTRLEMAIASSDNRISLRRAVELEAS